MAQDDDAVEKIKNLLDAIGALKHFVKPLVSKKLPAEKDERFYADLQMLWDELDAFTPLYDKVRNYLTRKPYSIEKIKLNFGNSTLLNGWDENMETDNTAVILRKDGLYYLAIMNRKYNKVFEGKMDESGDTYDKLVYKLLPGPYKMLPKVIFSKKRIDFFNPSKEILKIRKLESFKKGCQFNLADCHKFIDFYKDSIAKHEDWKNFGFKFSPTDSYEDISGFYREVERQGYKLNFRPVSVDYINSLVDEGKIYLFKIYNKDFSPSSKGTPNMHTLYWKMLFSEENLTKVVYNLNGEAEVFYRKASIVSQRPTHRANQPVANKNALNAKKESLFTYDLIKDRRFTVDKFLFHVPITMNFSSVGVANVNDGVREYLAGSSDTHIIGIDRGERHLLYLTVIDLHGNIKEQYSLNEIVNEYKGNTYRTNYHDLLDAKERDRQKSRQSWKTIGNIKELKEGYLSQVVHKISQLMVKYHAIVVLEDLNKGFMRRRQKVEKQVYQKFEKKLIDKLNFLVDKKADPAQDGGLLKAYQLTNIIANLSELGKQCGFLFYIPAWNTSKIDPVTGFVNLFPSSDLKYASEEKARAFFGKMQAIRYNESKQWFEFSLNYSDYAVGKADGTRTKWTLCTYGSRVETFRDPAQNNMWTSREFDLTEAMKALLSRHNIDIKGNLKEAIMSEGKEFFNGEAGEKGFYGLFRMMLQMRNSVTNSEVDYLISPALNSDGECFDSRRCSDQLPKNADANGAYNIARKGLMAIQQIKQADDLKKLKFDISNKAWLQFAQGCHQGD